MRACILVVLLLGGCNTTNVALSHPSGNMVLSGRGLQTSFNLNNLRNLKTLPVINVNYDNRNY